MTRSEKTTKFENFPDGGSVQVERFITFIGLDVSGVQKDSQSLEEVTVQVNVPLNRAEDLANKILEYVAEARR